MRGLYPSIGKEEPPMPYRRNKASGFVAGVSALAITLYVAFVIFWVYIIVRLVLAGIHYLNRH